RREKREMPVWALSVDKAGHKMTEHDAKDLDHPPIGPGPNRRGIQARNANMNYFAFMLSRLLDRNVVDKTGLAPFFDFTLDFARDLPPRVDGSEPPASEGPTIFTALREQLGLRLES